MLAHVHVELSSFLAEAMRVKPTGAFNDTRDPFWDFILVALMGNKL